MLKNPGVKNGIFAGITILVFSHVCYMINKTQIITGLAYISYLIPLYFMYRGAQEEKYKNEGILSFGEALKVSFLIFVICFFFYHVYTYLIFNVIDPSMIDVMKEVSINQAEMIGEFFGIQDQLEDLPEAIEEQVFAMDFKIIFMNYLVSLIFPGFIYALIMASVTKREPNA